MIVRSFLLVFGLLSGFVSHCALAAVDADQIQAAASQFLHSHSADLRQQYGEMTRIEYSVNNLDPRLSMADCPQPLNAELKSLHSIGRINIKISCQAQTRWSLYVPAEIKLYRSVVVISTPVIRGERLSASKLQLREMDTGSLSGTYFTDINDVIGMQAKRSLQADKPIIASHLEPPVIISRGDAVMMTVNSGGLIVKSPGKALMDGRRGQQISVRNSQSKQVVEARVVAPGQVVLAM